MVHYSTVCVPVLTAPAEDSKGCSGTAESPEERPLFFSFIIKILMLNEERCLTSTITLLNSAPLISNYLTPFTNQITRSSFHLLTQVVMHIIYYATCINKNRMCVQLECCSLLTIGEA